MARRRVAGELGDGLFEALCRLFVVAGAIVRCSQHEQDQYRVSGAQLLAANSSACFTRHSDRPPHRGRGSK